MRSGPRKKMRSLRVLPGTADPRSAQSPAAGSLAGGQLHESGRQPHGNVDDGQARIAAAMPTANLDLRLKLISCPDRRRYWQTMALPGLSGCQAVQGTVWAMFGEPVFEDIEPMLDGSLRQARQHQPPPDANGPECPLDFAVEIGCPESGLDRTDSHPPYGGAELPLELGAMVGDDESGLAEFLADVADQSDHVTRPVCEKRARKSQHFGVLRILRVCGHSGREADTRTSVAM